MGPVGFLGMAFMVLSSVLSPASSPLASLMVFSGKVINMKSGYVESVP
jgi:hypothetical protein